MDEHYFIVDEPLPEAINFELLKREGTSQLQALSGDVWTNYNESDPGVTILDQLCYALTELGYCAQFPIEDVLTQADGNIHFKNQFFEPQNILTSTPITPDDYRKLVLDNVSQVRVIFIEAEVIPGSQTEYTGRYNTYLSVKDNLEQADVDQVINRVHLLLNKHRNIAELFLRPKPLKPVEIQLAGNIWLTPSAIPEKVESLIAQALLNYAAPMAVQSGYNELLSQGLAPDEIFNGPKSSSGWITGKDALQGQCLRVKQSDLIGLIARIDGVEFVESLNFSVCGKNNLIACDIKQTEIPRFTTPCDTFKLFLNGLAINTQSNQSTQPYLTALRAKHLAASVEAKVDLFPELPSGQYRNTEEYYSVQNTFPDIYGIGYNSLRSDATNYRVAQSRQLKGYLMAFDQLLANQFSQLSHIGDLFSFGSKNARSVHGGFPDLDIPHKKFTTTYYCQPLYNIPDVKPLLRGHDAFLYQFDTTRPDSQIEVEAWKKYQQFQFNEYIYGLRQYVENESEATTRRDAMLSHLMARHGDDASVYDEMIRSCQWFGSELKTRIIVKTIWLQNYELLSYNRTRAFNINAFNLLPMPGDASIFDALQDTAISSNPAAKTSGHSAKPDWWRRPSFPTIDGEVDQEKIYSEAKLTLSDFDNFSAFELKAGILLGLSNRWRSLAGIIQSLLEDPQFLDWLKEPSSVHDLPGVDAQHYRLQDSDISVVRSEGKDQLFEGNQCLMDIVSPSAPVANDYQEHANQLLWLSTQRKGFLLIESILLLGSPAPKISAPYFLTANLIFPSYVTLIQQPKFKNFIDTLVALHWPAHVDMHYLQKPFDAMRDIITLYVNWKNDRDTYNSLLVQLSQKQPEDPKVPEIKKAAKAALDRFNAAKNQLALSLALSSGQGASVKP